MLNISEIKIRVKKILSEKGWSMKELLQKIDVSEQGFAYMLKNETMKVTTLLKIAELLDVPVSYFLLSEHHDERPYVSTIGDGTTTGNIRYVPLNISAGFISHYGDNEFMASLPTFFIPGFEGKTCYCLVVEGDSMFPTLSSGDMIFVCQVDDINMVRPNEVYAIVTSEGMVVKRIRQGEDKESFMLVSDNSYYPPFSIKLMDITAILWVKAFLSKNMTPRNLLENEIIRYKDELINTILKRIN